MTNQGRFQIFDVRTDENAGILDGKTYKSSGGKEGVELDVWVGQTILRVTGRGETMIRIYHIPKIIFCNQYYILS